MTVSHIREALLSLLKHLDPCDHDVEGIDFQAQELSGLTLNVTDSQTGNIRQVRIPVVFLWDQAKFV